MLEENRRVSERQQMRFRIADATINNEIFLTDVFIVILLQYLYFFLLMPPTNSTIRSTMRIDLSHVLNELMQSLLFGCLAVDVEKRHRIPRPCLFDHW